MGTYTPNELDDFVRATWIGAEGNREVLKSLAAISILECGMNKGVRDRTGHLGGHRKTIKVGGREASIPTNTPFLKEEALSRHFLILYHHYGNDLERTCRVWNKGQKYKCELAGRYWNGVKTLSKIYDGAVPGNGK